MSIDKADEQYNDSILDISKNKLQISQYGIVEYDTNDEE